jgi:hypothetical protein
MNILTNLRRIRSELESVHAYVKRHGLGDGEIDIDVWNEANDVVAVAAEVYEQALRSRAPDIRGGSIVERVRKAIGPKL